MNNEIKSVEELRKEQETTDKIAYTVYGACLIALGILFILILVIR